MPDENGCFSPGRSGEVTPKPGDIPAQVGSRARRPGPKLIRPRSVAVVDWVGNVDYHQLVV